MEPISNIFVRPCKNLGNLKAIVSLNYYGLVIRGLKLSDGKNGMFLGMPARKRGEEWEDICFFLDPEMREKVTKRVLDEYEKVKEVANL